MIIPCGHTICVNCVVQIIKLSEEEYEGYSNSSFENEYEDFFESDGSDHSESGGSIHSRSHHESNENSPEENESEQTDHSAAEEEEEEDDEDESYEVKFEIDDNIQDFNFDCCEETGDNKKKFFMGEESKRDLDDGKLIKFKCSLCRKKMKINSKQIIKNIQLSQLIKSLDKLHGREQYSGEDLGEEKELKNGISEKEEIDILNSNKYNLNYDKLEGNIFCNLCKNVFKYKDHATLNGITDFHKQNFMFIDKQMISGLAETFNFSRETEKNNSNEEGNEIISIKKNYENKDTDIHNTPIENKNSYNIENEIIQEIKKEIEFYKINLYKKFEKIIDEKSEINELRNIESSVKEISNNDKKAISILIKEFLIGFLNLALNYGLSKVNIRSVETDFDFFKRENRSFIVKENSIDLNKNELFDKNVYLEEVLKANNITMKDSKLFINMKNYVEPFSNFKKYKHKSFNELRNIYLSFESHLESKKFSNAEKKLNKAYQLLEKFFDIFDKLKLNFALYLKGKVVLQHEKDHISYIKYSSKNNLLFNNKFKYGYINNYNENLKNVDNFQVENRCFYTREDFKSRLSMLIQRKNFELSFNYMMRYGFFNSVNKNTIFSEKRYSTWVFNSDYKSKSRLYLFDNFLGVNVFSLNYNKLILTTQEEIDFGITPTEYSDYSEVVTNNFIPDEAGLNIYFIASNRNSKNFRFYSLANKALIKLPDIPTEYCTVDTLFHDNKLFILGGANDENEAILNCYYFDIFTSKWFTMPKLNIARYKKCSFIKNRCIYVYGGELGNNSDRDSCSSNQQRNSDRNVYSTQLWKFEVFDVHLLDKCAIYDLSKDSNKSNIDIDFKWKIIEISGFNQKLMNFGYGLIDESKLIILGGSHDENVYYNRKGFILDLDKKTIIEKLKIDFDFENLSMSSNFYRGTLQLFPEDSDDDKVINYNRNFDNLNVFI